MSSHYTLTNIFIFHTQTHSSSIKHVDINSHTHAHTHTHGHKHALAYIHAYIHVFKLNRLTYAHTYTRLHTDLNLTARNMKFPKPVLPTFLPIAVIFLDL